MDFSDLLEVENDSGVVFRVRVVKKGEPYGLDFGLIHEGDDPLVEFFDSRFVDKFGEPGMFVSRYYLSTLLDSVPVELSLDLSVEDWYLNKDNMREVIDYISKFA